MTTKPVAVRVSQATRLAESSAKQASRIASEIWSAILSGWPSVTDSEVNKERFFDAKLSLLKLRLILMRSGLRPSSRLVNWGDQSLGEQRKSAHSLRVTFQEEALNRGYQ